MKTSIDKGLLVEIEKFLEVLHNIEKIVELDEKVWTYKDKISAIKYAILKSKSNINREKDIRLHRLWTEV
jgi:hypothetical protein